jgi:hypothetical protein
MVSLANSPRKSACACVEIFFPKEQCGVRTRSGIGPIGTLGNCPKRLSDSRARTARHPIPRLVGKEACKLQEQSKANSQIANVVVGCIVGSIFINM